MATNDEDGEEAESYEDYDYDDEDYEDEEEIKPFFDKRATLQYLTDDNKWIVSCVYYNIIAKSICSYKCFF